MNKMSQSLMKFVSYLNKLQETIVIFGSILAAILLPLLNVLGINIFGINPLSIELSLTLILLGLLVSSLHQDHEINQTTRQVTQQTSQAVQNLVVTQPTLQQTLLALDTTTKNLDTHQSTIQLSLQTLAGSMQSLTRNKFFAEDDEAYKYLQEYINQHPVREAIFLQYSCQKSAGLLTTLVLNKKARATVFIQHEDMAEQLQSQRQVDRITSMIRNSLSDLSRKLSDSCNLKVYKYTTPATVRAIKIDDQVLCVGWYTYEKVDRRNYPHFPDDQIAVSGHDRPTIVTWKGTEEFTILDKMVTEMITNYQENAQEVEL